MTDIHVVNNHGQFTHLEQRLLRDLDGVDTELIDNETPPAEIEADGLVLSGGPSIEETGNSAAYLELDIPVLGICLGHQLIAQELDGEVAEGEYGGYADVEVTILDDSDPLVGSLAPSIRTWASHADEVVEVPPGFERTAESEVCGVEAMADTEQDHYGVQWHPEVAHTERGEELFANFRDLCE
ncbi:GMP synthase subunit A [Halodesulfurarchaeum sp.]|uniref:GMP synthase subunit A n=1 Tax=Halodesulfurarchaeum sp. TaxID=1980530 RepID=UPI002FC3D01E